MDGSALIVRRPGHARLIPMDPNALEVKTIFEELGCSKLGVVATVCDTEGPRVTS